jgi:hypothetical protein
MLTDFPRASVKSVPSVDKKKAKLTEGQRPKPYKFSGFTALNTYNGGGEPRMPYLAGSTRRPAAMFFKDSGWNPQNS